jgi:DNA repair protein RecN (Recombination protein N)
MLATLRIKNLALVSDLSIELGPGLNIVTGETGAGKSIIIGALNLVLGERAGRDLIRTGADQCLVEASFDVSSMRAPISSFLEENGIEACEDNLLTLKRVFTASGTNRQHINGSPASLSILGRLGEWLVDMHGPHEHQSLLHPAKQLDILDAYGKLDKQIAAFAALSKQYTDFQEMKSGLIVDDQTYAQQLELLRFQCLEIEAAALKPDDEKVLETDYQRARNSAQLLQTCQQSLDLLSESDPSLLSQMAALGRSMQELVRLDAATQAIAVFHTQASDNLVDLQKNLSRYMDKVDLDPERLREMEERVNLLHSLKKKYGGSIENILAFGANARQKLAQMEGRREELLKIEASMKKLESDIWRAGKALTDGRRKLLLPLGKAVSKQLADLGFKQSRFEIDLKTMAPGESQALPCPIPSDGLDSVDFQFAPNPGEPPKPLRSIASSGEMSRVMLAIKTVLAVEDSVPVLVFDEVDANVGGETASIVGDKMRQIGKQRQVLCITHLAPVAAYGTNHYVVTKTVKEGRAISEISHLDPDARVAEIARMLGGQTHAAMRHAEELLRLAN